MAPAHRTLQHEGETLIVSDNTAGYELVTVSSSGKFVAKPTLFKGGGQIDMGSFETAIEAAVVAARAVREYKEGTFVLPEKKPRGAKKKRQYASAFCPAPCTLRSSDLPFVLCIVQDRCPHAHAGTSRDLPLREQGRYHGVFEAHDGRYERRGSACEDARHRRGRRCRAGHTACSFAGCLACSRYVRGRSG
jgi:hypothetical protein